MRTKKQVLGKFSIELIEKENSMYENPELLNYKND